MEDPNLSPEEIYELIETKKRLEERDKQLAEELALASELQKSLLPWDYPQDLPIEISHRYIPYMDVGGDFFDYVRLDKSRLGIIITDVSGHGVASAFITAMFKSTFNHLAPLYDNPAEALDAINRQFCAYVRTDHYLTAFYIIIDTEKMMCQYCNAGHPKQLLIQENNNSYELTSLGFFLGMFEGIEYKYKSFKLHPGDILCLFTDGIIETIGKNNELYGRESLKKAIISNKDRGLNEISNQLITDLLQFMITPSFEDDITFLLVRMVETI